MGNDEGMPGDRAKRQWKRRRGKETLKEKTVEKKRRTQLGIGSWTYPYHCGLGGLIRPELAVKQAMPPCELIEKAKKYNLHYVQICENSPLAHCLPQELADIRRKAEENGIKLEVGMRGAARGNLLRMIAIAEKLDAKLLRCVIDDNGYEPDLEEIIITLKSVLPVLEEKDIVLGIENHDRFKAEEFAYIMERLDSRRYGIVLDTTNSLSQEETVEEVLNWLAKYTVCLHFKDYTIVRSPGSVGLQIVGTPVGRGRQKVEMILERLGKEAQQDFSTIIEFWMPSEDNLDKTLKKEEEWAEESIPYLKKLFGETGLTGS